MSVSVGASRFIGRVGGLAIALGVGAVAFGGAVAWADSDSTGSTGADSSARAGSARDSVSAGPQRGAKKAGPKVSRLAAYSTLAANSTSESVDEDLPAPAVSTDRISLTATPAATGTATVEETESPAAPAAAVTDLGALGLSRRISPAAAIEAPVANAIAAPAESVNIAWIMGGSGDPIPSDEYIAHVYDLYVRANSPEGTIPEGLVTPEGLYPITGVKSLPLNTSVDQGMTILMDTINKQLELGNTITVFGYSQSAILSSLVMSELEPDTPINFVFVGNEMNPNGGFLSRFPDLTLPSLGIDFYGATPADAFPVTNYMLQYDGFSDFPRYPLNFLSVLNAGMGIAFVHTKYPTLTPEQVAASIQLPTNAEGQTYYVIPNEDLPLLEPLRYIPLIGNPIADLLQPALKVIVNLGYGDPNYGWSTEGFANEQLTFGVLPDVNWIEVAQLFVEGIGQGIQDFIADITPGGSFFQELTTLATPKGSDVAPSLDSVGGVVTAVQSVVTNILDGISQGVTKIAEFVSNGAASLYASLLPTADIVNAIVTMLPAYALTQFLDGIDQIMSGDIINGAVNAILMPLAAAVGLVTTAALIELLVIGEGIEGVFIPS